MEQIMTENAKTTAEAGRNGNGEFKVGNPGGPGNPFGRRVAVLRRALLEALSEADLAAIVQALVVRAKAGDVQAAKLVLAYAVGKPETGMDPDRVDAQEWAMQRETAAMMPEL